MSDPRDSDAVDTGSAKGLGRMVLRGSAWLLLARILRSVLSLIGLAILARLLQPADFGVLVMSITFTFGGTVILSGMLDAPLTRHLELTREDLRGLVSLALGIMLALGFALWIAAPLLERAMAFPRLALGIRASVPVMVLQVYMTAGTAVLRRTHRFRAVALLSILNTLFYLVPAIALAAHGYGLWSVLAGQIVAALVTAIQFIRQAPLPLMPPRHLALGAIGHTGWYGVGTKLFEFASTSVDTLAVALYLGPAMTGIYSRAYNIGTQIKEPFLAVDSTIRQALVKMNDDTAYRRELDRILRLLVLSTSLLVAGLFVARREVVFLLLGVKFDAAVPILALLLLALPARTLLATLEGAMIARGRMRSALSRSMLTFAIMLPGVFIGAQYGGEKVALAVVIVSWSGALFGCWLFARDMKRSYLSFLLLLFPGLAIGLLMIAIGTAIEHLMPEQPVWQRLGCQIIFFATASGLIVVMLPGRWLPKAALDLRGRLLAISKWRVSEPPAKQRK